MNTWQTVRQVQYLVRSRKWTGSSTKVFHTDSVKVTAAPRESAIEQMIMPACLIRPMGASIDPQWSESPDLFELEVAITLAVAHVGDSWGEYPMLGGQRTGQTNSTGRGLLEVEEELFAAVELLNDDDGVLIQFRASSAAQAQMIGKQYVLVRDYLFRLWVSADRYYHPVINLVEA